jgi:hypothetical protein
MVYAVVYATERSSWNANMPTSAELEGLFRLAIFPVFGHAHWVGPTLRIVREATVGMAITHAAWLLEADDDATVGRVLQELNARLQGFSRDFSVPVAQPYAPKLHGSIAWWQDGRAAQTITRDMPRESLRRLAGLYQHESPIGPSPSAWGEFAGLGLVAATVVTLGIGIAVLARRPAPKQLPSGRRRAA